MPQPTTRLAWPDVAKGISIIGVVLLHITLMVPEGQKSWLWEFNDLIAPLRMPLFFLVSGFFSVKVLRFSAGELFLRRLWFFLVPYLAWTPIEIWLNRRHFHVVFDEPLLTWPDLKQALLLGHNMGWFLHALIIFNVALWASKRLPAWLAVTLSFLVPLACLPWHHEYHFASKAWMYLPVFFIGAYCRPLIAKFAAEVDKGPRNLWAWVLSVGAAGLFMVGYRVRYLWDLRDFQAMLPWPLANAPWLGDAEVHYLVQAAEQHLKLPIAVVLAVMVARIPQISNLLQLIGRNTLPIYLAHPIALTVCVGMPIFYQSVTVTLEGQWGMESTQYWIFIGFVASTLASLALWGLSKLPVVGWTLNPPSLVAAWERLRDRAELGKPDEADPIAAEFKSTR